MTTFKDLRGLQWFTPEEVDAAMTAWCSPPSLLRPVTPAEQERNRKIAAIRADMDRHVEATLSAGYAEMFKLKETK